MFRILRFVMLSIVLTVIVLGIVSAQDNTAEIPVVEINTSEGVVTLEEIKFDDRYPSGCDPNVNFSCFAVASRGYKILSLILSGNPGDVLGIGIYVTVPGDDTRYDLELGGLSSGRGLAAFGVPESADNFILYWPNNDPIPLDADEDGVWIYEDACPDAAGVKAANGCDDTDTDGDGVTDSRDLCPDEVGFARAEGCPDADEDTVADTDDSCPDEAGSPDAEGCPDADNDRIQDAADNCPEVSNRNQNDFNEDGVGDACQDSDADNFLDVADDCPTEIGTAEGCPDIDEDTVADRDDSCPEEAGSPNAEGCPDADNDRIQDAADNCPEASNRNQNDFNEDGIGDACQDSDADGEFDSTDQCPVDAGTLDGCPDTDEDGVADEVDECPEEPGFAQTNGCLLIGTVNGSSNVNLREGPGTNFAVVGTVSGGEELMIIGRNEAGDWLRIRTLDEEATESWIAAFLFTTDAQLDELPIVE